jgi:hypothetical protein
MGMLVAGVSLTVAKPAMGGLGARGSKSPSSSAGSLLNMSGWRGRLGRLSSNGGSATLSAATAFIGTKGPVTGMIGAMWSLSGVVDEQEIDSKTSMSLKLTKPKVLKSKNRTAQIILMKTGKTFYFYMVILYISEILKPKRNIVRT